MTRYNGTHPLPSGLLLLLREGPEPAMDHDLAGNDIGFAEGITLVLRGIILNGRTSENDARIETEIRLTDERFVKSRQDSRGLKNRTTTNSFTKNE